ncbi:MAG TPA: GWxTD domain-containing protein [Thermoanaerobaculia bacterium]|nr:GWxTD domain-containing protein [Thermoanaerobaculia bacterium]
MRLRNYLTAIAVAALALNAFALSAEYLEWGRGPAQFLMTKEEAAQWKTITGDDEAKAFVLLFWARRDPTADTPRNEFREEYERRVAAADKNFQTDKKRGALTDRGRVLILFGQPKRIEASGGQRQSALPGMENAGTSTLTDANVYGATGSDANTAGQVWFYEGDYARELFGQARSPLRFVDRQGKSDFNLERGGPDVGRATQKVIARAIVQPNLTAAPTFSAAPVAATAAMPIPEEPVVVQTELTTESLKAAVAELKGAAKNPYEKQTYATWGEYVTSEGQYFVPVQLYVPKSAGFSSSQSLTFFGVVQDESGKNVFAFEEPATLAATKEDFFVDRSLTGIPAGKYRGYFGLAEDGKAVSMTTTDLTLAGTIDKDASGVSPLLLSNNVYALSTAQKATDAHAFGGLKVVPKGDRVFRPTDELWYFIELRNPGTAEATQIPAEGESVAAVAPKVQIKIDVDGMVDGKKVRRPAAPREVEAIAIKGVPGHYAIGSSIPLESFKPGEYTFTAKVIDTVKKASYTVSEKFTVVQ